MVSLPEFASEKEGRPRHDRLTARLLAMAMLCLLALGLTGCAESDAPSSDSITDAAPLSQLPSAAVPDTATTGVRLNLSRGQTLYVPV